jgi:HlyD family secretion protein
MVNIAIWEGSDVLRVPLAALFRVGSDWTVYRVVDGRAVATPVDIDHRNTRNAEVLSGLSEGDAVILHPSDQISDEKTVVARE